jgi:protein ImuB
MFACVAAAGDVSADGVSTADVSTGDVSVEVAAALAILASDFSPRYEIVRDDLVIIDVSGLGRLLGTPQDIGEACCRVAHERGLRVGVAVAATQTAAMVLALAQAQEQAEEQAEEQEQQHGPQYEPQHKHGQQHTQTRRPVARQQGHGGGSGAGPVIVRPGQEAAALAPLPLSWLAAVPLASAAADAAYLRRPAPASLHAARARHLDEPPGKTRGKRGRISGWHYRLAPAPLPAAPPGDTAIGADTGGVGVSGMSPVSRAAALSADVPARVTARERAAADARAALLDILARWGLKTFGDFVKLPVIDVFERLGNAGVRLQQIARGQDARPLVHTTPEDPFEATCALEWPVDTLEPLSFIVSRLLEPLCARLERADRAAATLDTTLQLVTRERHTCRLELPTAIRDPKVLRTLVLLDLESHPPSAGIDRVTITIHPTPGRIIQHSLLTRALPSPEQLSTLTARLTAVMGDGRVGAPTLVDTHRPEAFAMQRFTPTEQLVTPVSASVAASSTHRVLRRFRQPVPAQVDVQDGRPIHVTPQGLPGGPVAQAAGPWRTSGDWWKVQGERADRPWDRDEWDVCLRNGHVYHLHHEPAREHWFVAGCYD